MLYWETYINLKSLHDFYIAKSQNDLFFNSVFDMVFLVNNLKQTRQKC